LAPWLRNARTSPAQAPHKPPHKPPMEASCGIGNFKILRHPFFRTPPRTGSTTGRAGAEEVAQRCIPLLPRQWGSLSQLICYRGPLQLVMLGAPAPRSTCQCAALLRLSDGTCTRYPMSGSNFLHAICIHNIVQNFSNSHHLLGDVQAITFVMLLKTMVFQPGCCAFDEWHGTAQDKFATRCRAGKSTSA
jgi:hypothetical protein